MGAPNAMQALRMPGRFCVNPTDLTAAWPHGGTGIGLKVQTRLRLREGFMPIQAEEFSTRVEVVGPRGVGLHHVTIGIDDREGGRLGARVTGHRGSFLLPGKIHPEKV